jgi:glyceraldehyde-3-phosphate dehydrogenase type I
MKIAINGFGRIGRIITRELFLQKNLREKLELVAVNDLSTPKDLAFLVKRDSLHGTLPLDVKSDAESITIDGQRILVCKESKPENLPWAKLGVDVVFECTGRFTDKESASTHLKAGAKKVIVSAPAKGVDATIVMGVNHKVYDAAKHTVISNASCTTNCLAPIAYVLNKKFGIERGLMTTVHSYTSDQRLLDNVHSDHRRARAAAVSMIPTTTGAAKTVGKVIPELEGKLDGFSIRVPTADVSFTDFVVTLKTKVSKEEINEALIQAAREELKGVLETTDEPLVSSDFIGNRNSSIVDLDLTNVMAEGSDSKGTMVKVCSWYDNEVGFSNRMLDLAAYMASK